MMSNEIQSALFLGEQNLTSGKPVYLQDKLIIKMYLGDKLVYNILRKKKVVQ
nr:MAG TPA: hypothetical protein [Caudoviricetes sp.]